jgi:hypothetical protein
LTSKTRSRDRADARVLLSRARRDLSYRLQALGIRAEALFKLWLDAA